MLKIISFKWWPLIVSTWPFLSRIFLTNILRISGPSAITSTQILALSFWLVLGLLSPKIGRKQWPLKIKITRGIVRWTGDWIFNYCLVLNAQQFKQNIFVVLQRIWSNVPLWYNSRPYSEFKREHLMCKNLLLDFGCIIFCNFVYLCMWIWINSFLDRILKNSAYIEWVFVDNLILTHETFNLL